MRLSSAIRFSVLDLCPIRLGGTATEALQNALDLARHAEAWGYHRYWVAEHHNIPGVASSATSVVIGHVAAGTSRIRVGSGGIMLPNHAPLVIAEQFGTLEALFPGRIDLGLGRAPGGDRATAHALRRHIGLSADSFPQDVVELQRYFSADYPSPTVRAVPGHGLNVPLYLLGSSTFNAELAGEMGLPFAFASHFAPELMLPALELYRAKFRPSAFLAEPYVMIGVNVFAADTNEEAARLFSTLQQIFLNLIRGNPREMPPPAGRLDWSPAERQHVDRMTSVRAVGDPAQVRADLAKWILLTGADEVIATAHVYDHRARLRSFELAASVFDEMNAARAAAPSELNLATVYE
jgi:luciferase family oxidoreductase group 1